MNINQPYTIKQLHAMFRRKMNVMHIAEIIGLAILIGLLLTNHVSFGVDLLCIIIMYGLKQAYKRYLEKEMSDVEDAQTQIPWEKMTKEKSKAIKTYLNKVRDQNRYLTRMELSKMIKELG